MLSYTITQGFLCCLNLLHCNNPLYEQFGFSTGQLAIQVSFTEKRSCIVFLQYINVACPWRTYFALNLHQRMPLVRRGLGRGRSCSKIESESRPVNNLDSDVTVSLGTSLETIPQVKIVPAAPVLVETGSQTVISGVWFRNILICPDCQEFLALCNCPYESPQDSKQIGPEVVLPCKSFFSVRIILRIISSLSDFIRTDFQVGLPPLVTTRNVVDQKTLCGGCMKTGNIWTHNSLKYDTIQSKHWIKASRFDQLFHRNQSCFFFICFPSFLGLIDIMDVCALGLFVLVANISASDIH
jgi:hypothetical protein